MSKKKNMYVAPLIHITTEEVMQAKREFANRTKSLNQLAKEYGVVNSVMARILY